MSITIDDITIEEALKREAKKLNLDVNLLYKKIAKDFIISQESKKVDRIVQNIIDGVKEVKQAKKDGKELKSAWELLDELWFKSFKWIYKRFKKIIEIDKDNILTLLSIYSKSELESISEKEIDEKVIQSLKEDLWKHS